MQGLLDIPTYLLLFYGVIFIPAVFYALALVSSGDPDKIRRGIGLFLVATAMSLLLQWLHHAFF